MCNHCITFSVEIIAQTSNPTHEEVPHVPETEEMEVEAPYSSPGHLMSSPEYVPMSSPDYQPPPPETDTETENETGNETDNETETKTDKVEFKKKSA